MTLDGQRIVVIGGSSGLGLATARAAARDGAEVTIASSRQERVDAALRELPDGCVGTALDVRDETQVAHGLSNQAIATELSVSIKAIEKSVTSIYRKLNLIDQILVDRRVMAAVAFLRTQTNPFVPPLRLVDPGRPSRNVS
jgi:NAD(P)-dependent dehydrogenase (short-subunit alcohol dehydrogenase family)